VTDEERIEQATDALDRMTDVVDSLGEYVIVTGERARHGTRYRLNLLWVHAIAALLMAPLFMATGRDGMTAPSFAFLRSLPGSPYTVGAVLMLGGLVVGMGCIFRAKAIEAAGLVLLGVFYLTLAITFSVPPVRWLLGEDVSKPTLYGPVLYAHLTVIMAMHIRALLISRRDDEAAANIGGG
jgi:hypothetical protein